MHNNNYKLSREYLYHSKKVVIFKNEFRRKYYICYILPDKIRIFEHTKRYNIQLLVVPFDFLIKIIMNGYIISDVLKSEQGKNLIGLNLFAKYKKLLQKYYGKFTHLNKYFELFLKSILYDDEIMLKDSMLQINSYIKNYLI